MTHDSNRLINSFQETTESILQKAIREWQMLPPEKLAAQPAPDKWSAAQCLQHLNIYGHHYLPAIENAIKKASQRGEKPATTFKPGWLGSYFTALMLPQQGGTLKQKMKSPKNAVPAPAPDPVATLAEFIEQQEKMLQLLERARQADLNGNRIPITLSPLIRLKLGDTFGFVIAHIERHVLQAERAISNTLQ